MKVLVFAPHAAIWVHSFPEALIADALQGSGDKVVYVSCGRLFERFCIPMAGNRLTPSSGDDQRAAICKECCFNDQLLRSSFSFSGPNLRQAVTPADLDEVEQFVATADRASLSNLEVDGLPIGKIALYQIVLRYKRFDLQFSDQEWHEYLIELRHALLAARATKNLIAQHKPDRLIVYNGLYSVNRAASLMAESHGIPAYFLHAGSNLAVRLQTMMLGRGHFIDWIASVISQWPRFSGVACPEEQLSRVSDHFLELVSGRNIFVYSQKSGRDRFDLRAHFSVSRGQKVLVATMSSYDEEMAVIATGAQPPRPPQLFPQQVDWIQALVDFVRARPDLFLIVRVHPREFPNRREGTKSQHAALLEQAFADLPANSAINWPSDGISLYDLADQTDVFLNAWSSAGKEMAMLGIPVVIYSRDLPQYPADINYLGETRESYFASIDRALQDGWSFETARQAYRWLALEFITATVFLGDSYPKVEHPHRSFATKVLNRLRRSWDPEHEKKADLRRRKARLGAAGLIHETLARVASTPLDVIDVRELTGVPAEQETMALRRELARIGDALFPTAEAKSSSRLFQHFVAA